LKGTKLSPATAYDYSKAIRMALRKAVNDNILAKNPVAGVKGLREPEADHIFLNVDEVQKLADAEIPGKLGGEIRRAFIFVCYTGLRISDIKSLKWGGHRAEPVANHQAAEENPAGCMRSLERNRVGDCQRRRGAQSRRQDFPVARRRHIADKPVFDYMG
jgi:hypothetical protein